MRVFYKYNVNKNIQKNIIFHARCLLAIRDMKKFGLV